LGHFLAVYRQADRVSQSSDFLNCFEFELKEETLSVRTRFNAVAFQCATLVAALIGLIFQSWLVFLVIGVVMIAMALHSGAIRPRPRRR
jgi:hypothetical protein